MKLWLCAIPYYYMLLYHLMFILFFFSSVDLICTSSMYGMHSTMLSSIFYIILLRACFFYCAQPECFFFSKFFVLYACLFIFFLRSFCLWWIDFVPLRLYLFCHSAFFFSFSVAMLMHEDLNKNWQIVLM